MNAFACLAKQLKPGTANALSHEGWYFNRHAGVQPDVARQKELVKVARRHIAGYHRANMFARNAAAFQDRACGFDAEVGGRDMTQRAAIVDHRRTDTVDHPYIVKLGEEAFCFHGVVTFKQQ